jgi:hypothetical protein
MMEQIVAAVADSGEVSKFEPTETAVNCYHNYIAIEKHYGWWFVLRDEGKITSSLHNSRDK